MTKLNQELLTKLTGARKALLSAGWDQVCSVMDDGDKSGRIDFGTLFIRSMAKPMPGCSETHRKFWLNIKTVDHVALFIDIANEPDINPSSDLFSVFARHSF